MFLSPMERHEGCVSNAGGEGGWLPHAAFSVYHCVCAREGKSKGIKGMADRIIEEIACLGSYGGTEVLYARCADGTVWRAARDRILAGDVVWRQVPPINDQTSEPVAGFTFGPPQPAEASVPAAEPIEEKQW